MIKSPVEKKAINKILDKRKSTENSKEKDSVRGSIQSMKPKF